MEDTNSVGQNQSTVTTTSTSTDTPAVQAPTTEKDSFEAIVDKDAKLDKFLLEALQLIKQMHELKIEIKTKQSQFDEDRATLLKSWYLRLHSQKLGNYMDILKAVEEITK